MKIDKPQRTKLTPPEVARRWGVSSDKVRSWIENGELRAINLAARLRGRPRYRIDLADLLAFERVREAKKVSTNFPRSEVETGRD